MAWLSIVAACAESDRPSGDPDAGYSVDAKTAETFDDFLLAEGSAFCKRLFHCKEADKSMRTVALLAPSQRQCEALVNTLNAHSVSTRDLRAKLADGRIRYVPEESARCLSSLLSCGGAASLKDPVCRAVFAGTVEPAGACSRSEECKGDAYCDIGGRCPGQCQSRKALGTTCSNTDECADSEGLAFCDLKDGKRCAMMTVRAPAAAGEACTLRRGTQEEFRRCKDDLWCDSVAATAGEVMCRKLLHTGDACDAKSDVCEDGLCDTQSKTCQTLTVRQAAGERCESASVVCNPLLGLDCVAGTCKPAGDGETGARCFIGEFQRPCAPGFYCRPEATDDSNGTCEALQPAAAECEFDFECESGACHTVCDDAYCAAL